MKSYRIRPLSIVWWLTMTPWFALGFYALAKWYEVWMKVGGELVCWLV